MTHTNAHSKILQALIGKGKFVIQIPLFLTSVTKPRYMDNATVEIRKVVICSLPRKKKRQN